jgi:hypothetical protein
MSNLLTCIPDANLIPFLLRRGSPVIVNGCRRVVSELLLDDGSAAWVAESHGAIERAPERGSPALDLTDETGRWHAARWLHSLRFSRELSTLSAEECRVITSARNGGEMSPRRIDLLARVVHRAAKRLV